MKRQLARLCLACCLCLPLALAAQEQKDDSRYLAGAVPEVDGKVVFSREFSIPGMSQKEIYQRSQEWLAQRLKQNDNSSRVVYDKPEEGIMVGMGDEWMVFSSTALALDRTRILYQVQVQAAPEQCKMEIGKVRYVYREGEEKYTAEEWITDEFALNKTKTKLVRGLAKWRRKTVDFMDSYANGLAEALSAAPAITQPQMMKAPAEKPKGDEPVVIRPKQVVVPAERPATALREPATQLPAAASALREVNPAELPADAIQSGSGRLVITIGSDPFNSTNMTANAGGSLGRVEGQPVVFTILTPDQPYQAIEAADTYTVRFFPNGSTQATLILHCSKLPAPAALDGMPRTYIGKILKAEIQ